MPTANLGTGTADSTTFLRGDQQYVAMSGGGLGGTTGSNDNRLLRSDGTGGSTVQASVPVLDDTGNLTGVIGFVAGSGSFAATSTFDAVMWSGGKLGFASTGSVTIASVPDAYFVRNSSTSIGVKKTGGADADFTAAAITSGTAGTTNGQVTIGAAASVNAFITIGGTVNLVATGRNNLLGATWQIVTDTTGSSGPAAIRVGSTGSIGFGNTASNVGTVDTALRRVSTSVLGVYTTETGATFAGFSAATITAIGSIVCSTAGFGIQIKSGTGARAGNATLVAGTVTVTNTTVTANTIVYLTVKTAGGTIGTLTYTLSAGASFTINSSNILDTSVVSYLLIELNP